MNLDPLSGVELVKVALSLQSCAGSLDQWRPEDLKALAAHFPGIFEGLAMILNHVELHGCWPQDLLRAYTALVPKDYTILDPCPTDFRPISVLSIVYRFWQCYGMARRLGL